MIDTVTKNYDPIFNTFCSYQVAYTDTSVTMSVPLDEANTDYQAIQQWISEGNTVIDNNE